jgi:hypothetical protein
MASLVAGHAAVECRLRQAASTPFTNARPRAAPLSAVRVLRHPELHFLAAEANARAQRCAIVARAADAEDVDTVTASVDEEEPEATVSEVPAPRFYSNEEEEGDGAFQDRVVQVRRVTKVVKGGKQLSFRAVVSFSGIKGKTCIVLESSLCWMRACVCLLDVCDELPASTGGPRRLGRKPPGPPFPSFMRCAHST